jgi:hypothetical protein
MSESALLQRVYDLFLTAPITSAFVDEDDGPDGEPPLVDEGKMVAVQADRFALMTAVRRLMNERQQVLPLADSVSKE